MTSTFWIGVAFGWLTAGEAALLAKLDGRLHDGAQIRLGPYVIKVKEYEHTTNVESEPAFKLKRSVRILADNEE